MDQSTAALGPLRIPNWEASFPISALDWRELEQRERGRCVAEPLCGRDCGGLSLIAPMLIMVLCKSLVASLVTVSLSVLIFAVAMAAWPAVFRHLPWVRRWKAAGGDETDHQIGAKEVLFVTAAYAAVLGGGLLGRVRREL